MKMAVRMGMISSVQIESIKNCSEKDLIVERL